MSQIEIEAGRQRQCWFYTKKAPENSMLPGNIISRTIIRCHGESIALEFQQGYRYAENGFALCEYRRFARSFLEKPEFYDFSIPNNCLGYEKLIKFGSRQFLAERLAKYAIMRVGLFPEQNQGLIQILAQSLLHDFIFPKNLKVEIAHLGLS
jgi:hypothetical protein